MKVFDTLGVVEGGGGGWRELKMYIPKHKHPAYNKEASGWMDEIFKVSLWGVAHQRCVLSTSAVHTVFKSVVNLGSGSVTV